VNGIKLLRRQQQADGTKAPQIFINEREQPLGTLEHERAKAELKGLVPEDARPNQATGSAGSSSRLGRTCYRTTNTGTLPSVRTSDV
jgi:hypothetical protein